MRTRIKELRARHNLTQEELAEKVGVSRQTILYVERGDYNPSLLLATKICRVLKCKVEELFLFTGKELREGEME